MDSGTRSTETAGPTQDTETAHDGGTTERGTEPNADTLDLQEANVVGVEVEASDGAYRFSVTLHHDDDGEDGYADWWQVETLDGERLGRREMLHAHGTEPFTRATTVEVPADVDCVVVRGHDQAHGYGGRAMVVDLESGDARGFSQGPARQPVGTEVCPSG